VKRSAFSIPFITVFEIPFLGIKYVRKIIREIIWEKSNNKPHLQLQKVRTETSYILMSST
jgi:hypothetical protein